MSQVERSVRSLRKKYGCHRHVNVRAIKIEAVAGRDDETDGRFGATESFHFADDAGQGGFAGTRPEHEHQFFFDVSEKSEDRKAAPPRDSTQHNDDEQSSGEIK